MARGNHRADTGRQRLGSSPWQGFPCTALPKPRRPLLPPGLPVLPSAFPQAGTHRGGHSLVQTLQRSEEKVLPLQESNQTLPAGVRPKGFRWESQAARLGNNVSALNLIYLLISQTTCFFYCIYFKHSFKLCIIFQSY